MVPAPLPTVQTGMVRLSLVPLLGHHVGRSTDLEVVQKERQLNLLQLLGTLAMLPKGTQMC